MSKLLVNVADNKQDIFEIEEGGGYYDKSKVIWDEREDGPLSLADETNLGGLIRTAEGLLEVDANKLQVAKDAKAAKEVAEVAIVKTKADRFKRLEDGILTVETMTLEQLRLIVKDLLEQVCNK